MPLLRRSVKQLRNSKQVQFITITRSILNAPQAVADAYYVLSDTVRRREYDALFSQRKQYTTADPGASESFFSYFANA